MLTLPITAVYARLTGERHSPAPDMVQGQALLSEIQAQVASRAQHNSMPLYQIGAAADGALDPI